MKIQKAKHSFCCLLLLGILETPGSLVASTAFSNQHWQITDDRFFRQYFSPGFEASSKVMVCINIEICWREKKCDIFFYWTQMTSRVVVGDIFILKYWHSICCNCRLQHVIAPFEWTCRGAARMFAAPWFQVGCGLWRRASSSTVAVFAAATATKMFGVFSVCVVVDCGCGIVNNTAGMVCHH